MRSLLDILDRLVRFETVSPASNLPMIAYIDAFLTERGFRVTQIPAPEPGKAGLFATIGPADPGGILLSGHTDVVPVTGQAWTRPPFELTRAGDTLFGRGVTDMKGFLAAMLHAADRAAGLALRAPLKLVFSYDEEIGCVGLQQMQDRLQPLLAAPELCIVGEPTGMQVAVGHKGKVSARAVCTGQNGHSALAPKFVNALHLACDFAGGLRHLQDALEHTGPRDPAYDIPYSTVHIGTLTGGTALNIVPARAELLFEFRHLANDDPGALWNRIGDLARDAAAPFKATWPGADIALERLNAYPAFDIAPDSAATRMAQELAQNSATTKVAFGTEAGLFAALGLPTVVCGPGWMERDGHKADESLALDQLAACARMMDRVVDRLT
ncbi:acetylornithine deacetylase [Actibacterium ureilyticum]|uniref:acetylornithine deacetylase n=1 Tax=Actibacterium ureilyticum TaxID=1590614 RepID=UPI000BAB1A39|nr:acetylornithine deacetylase [Actibacterium ureilyticum]